jgi:pimeloyl-ACP methyl ester carboxylesterase
VFAVAPLQAQQSHDLTGSYVFSSRSTRGDPFEGTIHVFRLGSEHHARIYTSIDPPLTATRVTATDSGMTLAAPLGSREITFTLALDGEEIRGQWAAADLTQPIEGKRVSPGRDLPPVTCKARGLDELVRCGVLFVPENPNEQDKRWIPLNIVVLPAGQSPAAGALFHFAGGPGQAATEQAAGNARRFATIRKARDIVMIDQRGTGRSNGLYCDIDDPRERAILLFGGQFPPGTMAACRDALASRADLRFYHTAVAAQDVDRVRRWLGYDRIDLYGGSYGTRAALAYLRDFPDQVRTATLRAVIAPSGSLVLDNPKDAQASLELLFEECAVDQRCAAAYPNLRRDFDAVWAALSNEPMAVRVLDPVTRDSVSIDITTGVFAGAMRRMLMDASLWLRVPLALHQAAGGDYGFFRTGIERTIGIANSLAWGMGISVVCAEDPPIMAKRDVASATRGTFLGDAQARAVAEVCPIWPAGTPPPGYDQPVHAAAPVLLLSGRLDPATPPRWGEEVAASLPNSLHLVLEGVSHSPFPDCAVRAMAAMVERGAVTGVDTSCVATLERGAFALP